MYKTVQTLFQITDRYAPSRMISFDIAHVFKSLQLMKKQGKISRSILVDDLKLGEGTIKTLVKHLKMYHLVVTSNSGMKLSDKGDKLYEKLTEIIPHEMEINRCSIALGKYNHVVIVKGLESKIDSGIEQRDDAVKMGAIGATTLIFKNGKFFIPGQNRDVVKLDSKTMTKMINCLYPENKDVIIIGSADDKKIAEFATKHTALLIVSRQHKHN